MQLTKNFKLAEFERSDTARNLGIDNRIPDNLKCNVQRLADTVQRIRDHVGRPLIITSGFRGQEVNRAVGGVANSAHAKALAADFHVPGIPIEELFATIAAIPGLEFDQLIEEFGQWIHIGLREKDQRNQLLRARKNSQKRTVYTVIPHVQHIANQKV